MIGVVGKVAGWVISFAFRDRKNTFVAALCLVAAALFAWHKIDKSSAVKQAVSGYVAATEIASLNAELSELKRRTRVAEEATHRFNEKTQVAAGELAMLKSEIEDYERQNPISPTCRVDDHLLGKLRSR